jgi:hypothetical protein
MGFQLGDTLFVEADQPRLNRAIELSQVLHRFIDVKTAFDAAQLKAADIGAWRL